MALIDKRRLPFESTPFWLLLGVTPGVMQVIVLALLPQNHSDDPRSFPIEKMISSFFFIAI
jgi:hypothetical protein